MTCLSLVITPDLRDKITKVLRLNFAVPWLPVFVYELFYFRKINPVNLNFFRDRCCTFNNLLNVIQYDFNGHHFNQGILIHTKRTTLLLASLFACISHFGQTKPIRELAPGVYFYYGDELQKKSANCVWIVFSEYVLVIDANYPWGATEIIREIRKTTGKPIRFVFNTHYHHDHSFGNCVFVDSGATIISTKETAAEMKTRGRREWDENWSGRSLEGYRREFPSVTFDERLEFDDGEHRVELINMGQAHTAGDGVAYLPNEKILVTGDLFVNGNPWGNNVADPGADYDKWLKVLDELAGWDITIVVPGHGELGTSQSLKNQRDYLADMLQQVKDGIKAGKTKEELIKHVDLGKHPVYGVNKVSTERSVAAMFEKLKNKAAGN
jgi:glyoxylase-like metal-dependent hydrolase (beta-lactamase superfamily II)